MIRSTIFIAAIVPALFVRCSHNPVAGGSSQQGNGIVTCMVTDADGAPVAGATARLRPNDYLADTAGATDGSGDGILTDGDGRLRIGSISAGDYSLEINDYKTSAVLMRLSHTGNDSIDLGQLQTAPYATIKGTVEPLTSQSDEPVYVQIYGLERLIPVDADGGYEITDLPAGEYTIRVVSPSFAPVEVDSVRAPAGDTTRTDVVKPSWKYSRKIYLNTSASGAGVSKDIIDFPVLVRLDAATFSFDQALGDGRDIRFAKPEGNPLPFEIEMWDSAGRTAAVWVTVDTIRGDDDAGFFVMYWGNPEAGPLSNKADVFSAGNGFAGVWHLADDEFADATENGNAGVAIGGTSSDTGHIGFGARFDGVDDYLDCGNDQSLALTTDLSISAWVNLDDTTENRYYRVLSKKTAWDDVEGYAFECNPALFDPATDPRPSGLTLVGWETTLHRGFIRWTSGWHHCAVIVKSDTARVFFDGVRVAEENTWSNLEPIVAGDAPLLLGGRGNEDYLRGRLDEVRVSSVARSAAWFRLAYENQRENQKLIEFR
ncbi:MAG: DUF2341 domain-containing protein [Chitinivibrionales bacterium]|nr:DUF2341 domain-containing protein [Chitinivibrionales bacterium]MBD3358531.1 DUF2341 domain-containing protein [Chitinivibrionales bacterium]